MGAWTERHGRMDRAHGRMDRAAWTHGQSAWTGLRTYLFPRYLAISSSQHTSTHRTEPPSTNTGSPALEFSILPASSAPPARFLPTAPPDQRKTPPKHKHPPHPHSPTAAAAPSPPGAAQRAARRGGVPPAFRWASKKRVFFSGNLLQRRGHAHGIFHAYSASTVYS